MPLGARAGRGATKRRQRHREVMRNSTAYQVASETSCLETEHRPLRTVFTLGPYMY